MTLRSSELQSDGDLDSIRNSCDVCNNDILELQSFLGCIEICVDPRIVFPQDSSWIKDNCVCCKKLYYYYGSKLWLR